MKSIEIFLDGEGWMSAELVDGKPSPEVTQLFGTHVLPLPFLKGARASEIVSTLQTLNPGVKITVRN
jgi:hypothetical protein